MTYGTSYFVSAAAVTRYYRPYGYDAAAIADKLGMDPYGSITKTAEIHIGRPPLKPGETLSVIDDGTRYAITTPDQKPRACEGCGRPLTGYMDSQYTVCMDCTRARARACGNNGRCTCGRRAKPGPECSNGCGRRWIPCKRCLGTIKQVS